MHTLLWFQLDPQGACYDTGFLFVHLGGLTLYGAAFGRTFYRRRCEPPERSALLRLPVDEEETLKLLATCEACVQAKKPFNLTDLFLMHVAFWPAAESSLFDSPALNHTQAVILILRECLNPTNSMRGALAGIHSRKACAHELFLLAQPYGLPVPWPGVVRMLHQVTSG